MHLLTKHLKIYVSIVIGLIVCISFWYCVRIFRGDFLVPQSFDLYGLTIHLYSLTMIMALGAGIAWSRYFASQKGIHEDEFLNCVFGLILCGFVGARLYHVLSELSYYTVHPLQIFSIWHGGLSIYGAVLGGILYLFFTERKKFFLFADILTPGVLLGQIIGRLGNFFNYELYGAPTTLPWGMYIPEIFRLDTLASYTYFHPLFLYEMVLNGVILIFLLCKKRRTGELFAWYIILYNVIRFGLEFLRVDSPMFYGIRQNALVSFCLFILGLILILRLKKSTHAD